MVSSCTHGSVCLIILTVFYMPGLTTTKRSPGWIQNDSTTKRIACAIKLHVLCVLGGVAQCQIF